MKHAGDSTLDQIEPLLRALRKYDGLSERKRGTFYRGSRAFLHFHEDPAGTFADVRIGADWQRMRVTTAGERTAFLTCLAGELGGATKQAGRRSSRAAGV